MKSKTLFISIGVIAIVVILAVIMSNNQSQTSQTPTTTSVQSSVTQSPQTENQSPVQSPQSKCDTDAKSYFTDYKAKKKNTDTMELTGVSYQNHYSQNNGSCYVLVNENWNVKDVPSLGYYNMIIYSLIDVSKKDPNGNYEWIGLYSQNVAPNNAVINRISDCNVGAIQCSSLNSFLSLVNPYLGK